MKVGNYTIPDLRLFPKIHHDIKLIYENYRLAEAEDADVVAKLVGHKSANSGAWLSKLADMRLYGLLESRAIKATPLAEKLTYGTEQEKQEAINKAFMNVPLWRELFNKFGVELPESNFWVQLQRITGLDPLDAQKYADFVRKAYLDDISHIKPKKEEKKMPTAEVGAEIDTSTAISAGVLGRLETAEYGTFIFKDKGSIAVARKILDLIENKLKAEKEEIPKEEG